MQQIDIFETGMSVLFNEPEINHGHSNEQQTLNFLNIKPINVKLPDPKPENNSLFAHHIWKSCVLLCKILLENPTLVKDKLVLELGAGHGIPSIVASLIGARVTASDYPDEDIIKTLKHNFQVNDVDVQVIPHVWNTNSSFTKQYDIIIMADTLWMVNQHDNLIADLLLFLKPRGKVIGTAGLHSGQCCLDKFFGKAKSAGFLIEELIPVRLPIGIGLGENKEWQVVHNVIDQPMERNRYIFKYKLSKIA